MNLLSSCLNCTHKLYFKLSLVSFQYNGCYKDILQITVQFAPEDEQLLKQIATSVYKILTVYVAVAVKYVRGKLNVTACQSNADHPRTGYTDTLFCFCH